MKYNSIVSWHYTGTVNVHITTCVLNKVVKVKLLIHEIIVNAIQYFNALFTSGVR